VCAFGGLTDGFLPFELPDNSRFELKLASVVMKVVQAHVPNLDTTAECAGKLGDDASMVKAQVFPCFDNDIKVCGWLLSAMLCR
jgi:hypothetical protein